MRPHASYPPAQTVDEYLHRLSDHRGAIAAALRQLIRQTVPKARETMLWDQPVYDLHGPMCFLKAFRGDVRLGFWRGDQLPDLQKILYPRTDRLRHVTFKALDEIDQNYLKKLLRAAASLNWDCGDPTRSSLELVKKIPR